VRYVALPLLLWVALSTCAALAAGSGGVRGVLYRVPIAPVCREGVPCDAPAPGVTLVFTRAGQAFRVRTGIAGRFSRTLEPGIYLVRVAPAPSIGSGLAPRSVRVPVGGWTRVRLTLDTGIR
jgi:hypothetical protein